MPRFDVHSHLLPGVDDGCPTLGESLACARSLVHAGYAEAFCTPHIWPNLPANTPRNIERRVADLQAQLDRNGIALKLHPGGEINLQSLAEHPALPVPTFGMRNRFVLVDFWADAWPEFADAQIGRLQSMGLTVILAHPERLGAIQNDPTRIADRLAPMGVLLQGNLACFSDAPELATNRVATQFLREGRYFLLGSDLHNMDGWPRRLAGLHQAIALAGAEAVDRLTIQNPRGLIES